MKLYREYSPAPTDDLIRFCILEVKGQGHSRSFLGPTWVCFPNAISIGSAIFAGLWLTNFPYHVLDLQLMGDHLRG